MAINEIHFRTYCLLHYLEHIINNKLFFPKLNFNNFLIYFTEEKLKSIKLLVTGMCQE